MANKSIIFGILMASLTLSGCQDNSQNSQNLLPEPLLDNGQSPAKITEQSLEKFADLSIPALRLKSYDGRDLKLGKILDNNSGYTRYYITYQSGRLKISGIMNVPKGSGPWPVLILNHGYIDTSVYTNGRGLRREQDYLARNGYIVIHPDYRNHAQSDKDPEADVNFRLGYAEDVINLIQAVKNSELDFFDQENIGMLGHSMGGGVALNIMAIKPDLVKAFVLFAPVSANPEKNFERWIIRRPETAKKIVELYQTPEKNPEFWKNINPGNFLDRLQSPVLIHHGTADKSVPLEWSVELEKKLKEADKTLTLYTYEGEPHEFAKAWPQVMERSLKFFNLNLKNSSD